MSIPEQYDGDDLSLSGIRSLPGLLERLPLGVDAKNLAQRLGVWTPGLHVVPESDRIPTPTKWGDMSDLQLSNWHGYWRSETARSMELLGIVDGQKDMLTLRAKSARASARSRVRKTIEDKEAEAVKAGIKLAKPTAGHIADLAEEDPGVIAIDLQLGQLAVIVSSIRAFREISLDQTMGLSREMSMRQAQMNAKLR